MLLSPQPSATSHIETKLSQECHRRGHPRPTLAALNRRVACEPGEPLGSSSSSSSSSVCDVPYVTGVSSVCDVAYVTGRIQELHLAQLLSYPLGTYWQQVCIEW